MLDGPSSSSSLGCLGSGVTLAGLEGISVGASEVVVVRLLADA